MPSILISAGLLLIIGGAVFFAFTADFSEPTPINISQAENEGATEFTYAFNDAFTYEVFTEAGKNINISIAEESTSASFMECYSPCNYYGERIIGYSYAGEIYVDTDGEFTVNIEGEGWVTIREWGYDESIDDLFGFMAAAIGAGVLIKGLQLRRKFSEDGSEFEEFEQDSHEEDLSEHSPKHFARAEHLATIRDEDPGVVSELGDAVSSAMRKPFSKSDEEDDEKLAKFDDNYLR